MPASNPAHPKRLPAPAISGTGALLVGMWVMGCSVIGAFSATERQGPGRRSDPGG